MVVVPDVLAAVDQQGADDLADKRRRMITIADLEDRCSLLFPSDFWHYSSSFLENRQGFGL